MTLQVAPVGPFRLDLTVWALKRRPDYTVDAWDGTTYQRVLLDETGTPFTISVRQVAGPDRPVLAIELSSADRHGAARERERTAIGACEKLLGTSVDLSAFYETAARSDVLAPLVQRLRGLKPPRYLSLFEALANAITCQQITLTAGLRILDRFAAEYGVRIGGSGEPEASARAFPRRKDIAGVDERALREAGYSRQKSRAVALLASESDAGLFDAESYTALDDASAVSRMRQLYGVGRWTAEYALLRGLGRLNVFPGDDVGVRRRLEQWLDLPEHLDYQGVQELLEPWAPFAGLVYLHLVVNGIVDSGLVPDSRTAHDYASQAGSNQTGA